VNKGRIEKAVGKHSKRLGVKQKKLRATGGRTTTPQPHPQRGTKKGKENQKGTRIRKFSGKGENGGGGYSIVKRIRMGN